VLDVGDDRDGRAPPISMRRGRGDGAGARGSLGRGGGRAGCAQWRERRERRLVGLGRKEGKNGRERPSWAVPRGRKRKEEKEDGLGQNREKRERKKNCIQMHLNLNLKFKFKWKTNNKTMQCSMKCTKPIFPYISFYG
jgi:hypothetical protein